ncbi:hypothetical protein D0Z07_7768 [Hyphodiscus hymeniophilus]|uniref:DUF6536 domain-containing protein n=1 Tax=Hyphodiscus hymeniophilus TaxID=353542 RepID=A0A9P6VCK0_9HELO|nr:hypothetical protein D0Z07_7768 [Hyphodiscus hymeniophilus]
MQVISSPTRKEVDVAHQKGRWLDIGVPSTRNLREISWLRIAMWSVLALSSIPLHLMYNTAVFASTTANAYDYMVVSEDFLTANANISNTDSDSDTYFYGNAGQAVGVMHNAALNGSLTKMDNSECTLAKAQAVAGSWEVMDHPISYCLVEEVEEECRLQFSLIIMLVVILANATKAVVMFITWRQLRTPTLVTIGDAITSFLDKPDTTTAGICLATRRDILASKGQWKSQGAKQWIPVRQFWFRAASIKRWLTCNILCWFFIIIGIVLLREGMKGVDIYDLKVLWELGFGQVNTEAIVSRAPKGLIAKVLFANLPQGILSFLYLTYNGLYSCMLGAHEWSLFATRRRTVRVTTPVGKQRSTYYLQLPYWYAAPLLLLSGLLHWLMSQSLFLALVDIMDDEGNLDTDESVSTVGYSCIAIFFAIIVGVIAVTAGLLNGFRRYNSGIPLVGSCSAAISAACHRQSDDASASLLPLKWGSVDTDSMKDIGHCCLSSFEVTPPEYGILYAGKSKKED